MPDAPEQQPSEVVGMTSLSLYDLPSILRIICGGCRGYWSVSAAALRALGYHGADYRCPDCRTTQ